MTTPTIEFSAQAVAPLALFTAKHDVRHYLSGVCVTPAPHGPGCILAATNGHQMGVWYDAAGECSEKTTLIIEKPLIEACQKYSTPVHKVKIADGRLMLVDSKGADVFIQPGQHALDGKYPDIWRVIPRNAKLTPGLHGYMATRYLRAIGKAGKLIERQSGNAVAASHYTAGDDGQGLILTRFERAAHFMVITMPMRGEAPWPDARPTPACFTPPVRPAVEATANFPYGSMGEEVPA